MFLEANLLAQGTCVVQPGSVLGDSNTEILWCSRTPTLPEASTSFCLLKSQECAIGLLPRSGATGPGRPCVRPCGMVLGLPFHRALLLRGCEQSLSTLDRTPTMD